MKDEFSYERSFWNDCRNTYSEESKQIAYAQKMGLQISEQTPWILELEGKKILDIGGGPTSLLLKTYGLARAKVIDPLQYPTWIYNRYDTANIEWQIEYGEYITEDADSFDEVWIYNVLQHTRSPEKIIDNAKKIAPVIRMFEWINLPAYEGHPQALTKERLDTALGAIGSIGKADDGTDCYHIWLKLR
jgi:2-polyprenyl-3-methyl-5-hydroxy-6-metoxy-1,4-benzoquinol methylase